MGQKLDPQDNELYKRTDEVLHYIWDPIGVCGAPGARDEYWSYLPTVYGLLKEKDRSAIIEFLLDVEINRMGLSGNKAQSKKHAKHVTDILFAWHDKIFSDAT